MRQNILVYINGKLHKVKACDAKKNLSEYLRENLNLKGTKIVCSEGDCGACTVLIHRYNSKTKNFIAVNSCIAPMYLLDCCHIITVEGLEQKDEIHPVQEAMAKHHGTQCGFCTPGIVNSLVSMSDDLISSGKKLDIKKVKNYTTGNLCRCTGYKGIVKAGMALDLEQIKPLYERYHSNEIELKFDETFKEEVYLKDENIELYLPKTIQKAIDLKSFGFSIISGGTDISVFVNKGYNKTKKFVSLVNIEEMYELNENENFLEVASRVSLTKLEKACEKSFPTFSDALKVFASPQIKNKGTLVGNVANGSPIGDTIPFLFVSDAVLELTSRESKREILVKDFYLGYKQFDLKDDEIITKIKIPKSDKEYKFYKVSARKDLDISAVSLAISYKIEDGIIEDISLAYGGVAATVYKAKEVENLLLDKEFTKENIIEASKIIPTLLSPFSDHRGSSEFRIKLCQNLLLKFFNELTFESEAA